MVRLKTTITEENQSETPLPPLSSYQRYHIYPARRMRSVHWSITGKCNFQCRHCLVSAPSAYHPELPLSDCLHIVEEIARCGISRVDITGGEPLVRHDFEEIVKALTAHNIDIGVLFTNASLLTDDTLDMLKRYRQHPVVQLSFDGLGHHDWLRGIPGAEKQTDDGFCWSSYDCRTVQVNIHASLLLSLFLFDSEWFTVAFEDILIPTYEHSAQ